MTCCSDRFRPTSRQWAARWPTACTQRPSGSAPCYRCSSPTCWAGTRTSCCPPPVPSKWSTPRASSSTIYRRWTTPSCGAAVEAYAKNLGIAFQIVDGLVDVEGDAAVNGKDAHQDAGKTTFVSFAGIHGARELARELSATSEKTLVGLGASAEPLRQLAR